jgi:hypothetical protein
MRKLRIGVVIPCLLAFEECVKCLESVRTKHIWTPYIVPQWKENLSLAKAWNTYSEKAFYDGCDYVVIANDDILFYPWTIDALIDELSDMFIHLVSGQNTNLEFDAKPAPILQKTNLNFSCFAISPMLSIYAGSFDENFYPAYFEDNDMHYRMQLLGLDAYGFSRAQFYHKGSVTSQAQRRAPDAEVVHEQFRACRAYYVRKWGGEPGEEQFTHPYNDPSRSSKEWIREN